MHASVRALLDRIIDYAGLFPPAKLPLDVALEKYLHSKSQSPHAWMLGRFVCPAAKLPELLTLAKTHPNASLLSLTVLGTQSSEPSQADEQLHSDMQALAVFRNSWGKDEVIDQFELATRTVRLADPLPPALAVFLETPRTAAWRTDVEKLASEIAVPAHRASRLGLKLRSGGVAADAFPSNEDVAFFIHHCRARQLPWKATAGLHHPRRHFDKALNLWHHGIFNVFGAGVLAHANPLTETDIAAILADRAGEHFRFENDGICWRDWSCTTQQIAGARSDFARSFGSCSFDEPCDDLLAMGLLDRA